MHHSSSLLAIVLLVLLAVAVPCFGQATSFPGLARMLDRTTHSQGQTEARTVDSCTGADPPCPPNYHYLGQGFDVLVGLRTGVNVLDLELADPPATAVAFGVGPITVPQGVTVGTLNYESTTQSVYRTSYQVQQNFAGSVRTGLGSSQISAVLGQSSDFQQTVTKLRTAYMVYSFSTKLLFDLTITSYDGSQFVTTDEFEAQVAQLPAEYNSESHQQYKNFILNFGTHIIYYLSYGAELQIENEVQSCDLAIYRQTLSDLSGQLQAKFMNASGQANSDTTYSALLSKVYSSADFQRWGGDPSFCPALGECDWPAFAASVNITNAHTRGVQLFPIESVIANSTISANMRQAVADYLLHEGGTVQSVSPMACSASGLGQHMWLRYALSLFLGL